jgi:hypothetical protein
VHEVPVDPGKSPVESVEHVERSGDPASVNATAEPAANPVPVAVTVEPTDPEIGDRARLELTLKFAAPEFVPSDADTLWGPFGAEGTVKVHAVPLVPGKLPLESLEHVDVTATPENEKEMVELAANPVPDTATELPTVPFAGEIVTAAPAEGRKIVGPDETGDCGLGMLFSAPRHEDVISPPRRRDTPSHFQPWRRTDFISPRIPRLALRFWKPICYRPSAP